MKLKLRNTIAIALTVGAAALSGAANAACSDVSRADLQNAIDTATGTVGGFALPMWLTFVDETGKVCDVVTSGATGSNASNTEWLGSRVISAQKANTANAFSIDGVSISSGALMAAVQPGGSLFGLSDSNPVDASRAYRGNPRFYGTHRDPLKGKRIGGVNTFGGGLAIYKNGVKIGALGVSGDTSCTDHATVWKVRDLLSCDEGPGGFEKLTLTTGSLDALGFHTDCGDPSQASLPGFSPL